MSDFRVGAHVRIHVRGHDLTGEIIALSRSRATVSYTDTHGESRLLKLPLNAIAEVSDDPTEDVA